MKIDNLGNVHDIPLVNTGGYPVGTVGFLVSDPDTARVFGGVTWNISLTITGEAASVFPAVTKIWQGSLAEFEAIAVPVATTLYFVARLSDNLGETGKVCQGSELLFIGGLLT